MENMAQHKFTVWAAGVVLNLWRLANKKQKRAIIAKLGVKETARILMVAASI